MQPHKRLMTLLSKLGIDDEQRHDMVYQYTRGRTQSTRDLTLVELNDLCARFQAILDEQNKKYTDQLRRLRSLALSVASRAGIKQPGDWESFNRWMINSSVHHKRLDAHTLEELNNLIQQLRAIEHHNTQSAAHPGTKAWYRRFGSAPCSN